MELVEHDGLKAGEEWILLEARGQHTFGGDEQPRGRVEPTLEANLPPDLAADGPAALGGDARGDRARRDATRLQQNERSRVQERRRHTRGLPRAGLGGDDGRPPPPDGGRDVGEKRIDRQWENVLAPGLRAPAGPIRVVVRRAAETRRHGVKSPPRHKVPEQPE